MWNGRWDPCAEFKSSRTLEDALAVFEAKASFLANSRLWEFVTANKLVVSIHCDENRFSETHVMPDGEMLSAYILPLRLFIQDKDGISPPCMSAFYKECKRSPGACETLREICSVIKTGFDTRCPIDFKNSNLDFKNSNLTFGDHFFGWIYGDFAHVNADRYPVIQQMNRHPISQQVGWYDFVKILGVVHVSLQQIRFLNRVAFPWFIPSK